MHTTNRDTMMAHPGEWFAQVGMAEWRVSTGKAMRVAWDDDGRPTCKLLGRPMLDPAIFDHLPFSSADSTNLGHTIGVGYA
ncbi:hypothetical protein [Pseudomonas sp. BN411]|uniref:hypothetical protein n=1 Tax=Pseudomonas sp. BN411 TaxID=2567887 RepID=UPI0024582073|nr:hypothetical protein [Pseudomonas sp. BN411]MDH4562844.1 hypothetical protein [Pseudomonas sp. BN411]